MLMFVCGAYGQGARQYSFTHFSTADGLAANTVTGIVQDADGYMWIATINGLQRYDGKSLVTMRSHPSLPGAIPSDHIPLIYADRKKNIWISDGENRVGTFDPRTFRFRQVEVDYYKRQSNYIDKYFFETPEGDLMLLDRHIGLYRFDSLQKKFVRANEAIPFPKGWSRDGIYWDQFSRKYFLCADSGLALYDPARKLLAYRGHKQESDPALDKMASIRRPFWAQTDRRGNVMLNTWEDEAGSPTLHIYDRASGRYRKGYTALILNMGYNEIHGYFEQSNGRTWMFGLPFLVEWKGNKADFNFSPIPNEYRDEQSIKFDHLFKMYEDREKNVWICTNNGLYYFSPEGQVFNSHNLMRFGDKASYEAPANAFVETKDGTIYVGCWGRGLYSYDRNFNVVPLPKAFYPEYSTMSIWDLHQHSKTGQIWIAQQGGRMFVYDPKTQKRWKMEPEAFGRSTIRQMVEDKDGNLWFGTNNGTLIKWTYQAETSDPSKGYQKVDKRITIRKMMIDREGFLWVASEAVGLLKYDPGSNRLLHHYRSDGPEGQKLFNNVPTDILQYDDTTMLVLTSVINVLNTKTHRITHFTKADGLPSNTAQSVIRDSNDFLWVGMTDGLCRVNLKKKTVTHFDRRDGITYDNFNPASAHHVSGGRLLFTTDHNFLVFNPSDLVESRPPGKPVITSFRVGNSPLLVDSLNREKKVVLQYNNNSLSFEFSALSYQKLRRPNYYYMLENLDKDWIPAGEFQQAVYNYLPPGKYVFRVKAENAFGLISEETRSFTIEVRPPVWNTWWFYGALVLVVIAVLVWLDRQRMSRLKAMQQMRSRIAGNLHHDINTTLSNISILSEMAKMKADKDIVRSKEYIQQISEKSHNMMTAMDDMLWSINPGNDTMEKTLVRLNEFVHSLQTRYGAAIHILAEQKVRSLKLDMDLRHGCFLLLKAVLRAIVEDAGGRDTSMHAELTRAGLLLKIRDNTAGHPGTHAFTKRIEEMYERAASINADVDLQTDSKGISLIITVPLYSEN
jgi:ligand-binding sensor domain-containing protein/signal transduction histidine kinase